MRWVIPAVTLALAGCVVPDGSGLGPTTDEFDGGWTVVSDTGLITQCVMIVSDRVTQASECNVSEYNVLSAQFGVHGENQHVWVFTTQERDTGEFVQRTISVTEQSDGSLRGTYSLRFNSSLFAITDNILMVRRF